MTTQRSPSETCQLTSSRIRRPPRAGLVGLAFEKLRADLDRWELERLLSGPYDKEGAVISINAGAGGTDADFVALIRAAVERQLAVMPHVMLGGMVHEQALTLARQIALKSPLDIADVVKDKLLHAQVQTVPDDGSQAQGLRRSWVFTSATLGSDPQLRWFTEPCGLQDADILQVQSPFDYANQAYLYVPRQMVSPKEAGHSEAVAELAQKVMLALGGRTLVLTTTQRALRAIADHLTRHLPPESQLSVLVQGQGTKRELMQSIRRAIEPGEKGAVLVATASFWEGFDVPGDALQAVIIDKLPFPPPNDPLVEARSQRLTAQGKSPFVSYFLPEAGVSLKQGAGRLIRRESDRGLLVVADHRLVSTDYGRRLLSTLPPMKRLDQWPQVQVALEELTKK